MPYFKVLEKIVFTIFYPGEISERMRLARTLLVQISIRSFMKKVASYGIATLVAVSFLASTAAFAQNYVVHHFKRENSPGDGKENSPLGSIRYTPGIKNGETITIFANGFDDAGDRVFVDFYVNGKFYTSQSQPPYAAQIGPGTYKRLPAKITVAVRDDYGNLSRADVAITSAAFASSYSCSLKSSLPETVSVVVSEVTPTQTGNTGLSLTFTENNSSGDGNGNDVKLVASLTLTGTAIKGNLSITTNSTTELAAVTGSATYDSDGVTVNSFTVKSSGATSTLSCS